jgi:hypothetical protein
MKPDIYSKAVLTIIALALVLIACNQYVHPATTASAQAQFAGVQYVVDHVFFDTRTGEIWTYFGPNNDAWSNKPMEKARLVKLGQPLEYTNFFK